MDIYVGYQHTEDLAKIEPDLDAITDSLNYAHNAVNPLSLINDQVEFGTDNDTIEARLSEELSRCSVLLAYVRSSQQCSVLEGQVHDYQAQNKPVVLAVPQGVPHSLRTSVSHVIDYASTSSLAMELMGYDFDALK